jgi:hypothetical protein
MARSRSALTGSSASPLIWRPPGITRAKAQGIEVKDRGRIPAELVVKFKAAMAP